MKSKKLAKVYAKAMAGDLDAQDVLIACEARGREEAEKFGIPKEIHDEMSVGSKCYNCRYRGPRLLSGDTRNTYQFERLDSPIIECRRFPPVAIIEAELGERPNACHFDFPRTLSDEYCGEWKHRWI